MGAERGQQMDTASGKYHQKKILIGITGGIGAYKIGDVIRYFVRKGAEVRTIMTEHATAFITPLTIETLSGNKVITHIFPHQDVWNPSTGGTHHIDIAQWPDLFLIAPATANIIGKITHGIADDALSTIVMATTAPVAIAPAMNDKMYLNAAVQSNLEVLRQRGYTIIEPDSGYLACGYASIGRLAELEKIVWHADKILLGSERLRGRRLLITAGPTQEPIDPVRYISNHSSGKMGYALARQASLMGAEVTLISGPVALKDPYPVQVHWVNTAAEMAEAVLEAFPRQDALIMAAAVADYTPQQKADGKLKKETLGDHPSLTLTKTIDILAECAKRKTHQILIGFALETDQPLENARKKMAHKKLDAIVLNNPNTPGAGFQTDTNVITYLTPQSEESFPLMSKEEAAAVILEKLALLFSS